MRNGYTLRYSGGMAPDCNMIFAKNEGIFCSVSAKPHVDHKLRLLYECLPIGFLIEKAGGKAHTGEGPLLEMPV